jgi:hypothetical protein
MTDSLYPDHTSKLSIIAHRAAWLATMAMDLSAASPTAGAGRPRSAARPRNAVRSISRASNYPSNNANFTPFEAEEVSNMVFLLAVGSRYRPARVIDRPNGASAKIGFINYG